MIYNRTTASRGDTILSLLLAAVCCGLGCAQQGHAPGNQERAACHNVKEPPRGHANAAEPADTPAKARAKQLAKLTAEAYRNATALSFEAHITYGNPVERIHCVVENGLEERCHLRVFDQNKKLFYELRVEPIPGGVKIREDNYRGDESGTYELAPEEHAYGKWGLRFKKGIRGCAFGECLRTWVGPGTHRAAFWEETIPLGEIVATERVNGHLCEVVETHRVEGLTERIYIDRESYVVRRWRYDFGGVIKDRVYSNIRLITKSGKSIDDKGIQERFREEVK